MFGVNYLDHNSGWKVPFSRNFENFINSRKLPKTFPFWTFNQIQPNRMWIYQLLTRQLVNQGKRWSKKEGSKTREKMIRCTELRVGVDEEIRQIAAVKHDSKVYPVFQMSQLRKRLNVIPFFIRTMQNPRNS